MRIAAMVPGFALLLAIGAQSAGAADTPPDVLLEELTTEVLTDLKLFERGRPGAPARIIDLVVPKILPLLDLDRMTSNKNRRGESKLRTPVKSLRDFSLLMYAYVYSAAQRGNQPEPMHALIPSHGKGSGNINHGPCDITKLSKLSRQDARYAIVGTL